MQIQILLCPHFSFIFGRVVLGRVVICVDGALTRVLWALLVHRDATADRQRQEKLDKENSTGDAEDCHHVEPIVLPDDPETVAGRTAQADVSGKVEERLIADTTTLVLLLHVLEELEAIVLTEVLEEGLEVSGNAILVFLRVNDVFEALGVVVHHWRGSKALLREDCLDRGAQQGWVDLVSAGDD